MTTPAMAPEGRDAPASRPSGRPGPVPAPVVVGAATADDDAVAWALRHARRHGRSVRLVRAYDPGDLWPGGVACALGVPRAGLHDVLARSTLTRARRLARAAGWPRGEDPAVEVREGDPVDALLEASRDASMVVVGHRSRSVWGTGSVALGMLHHARSPVTVVREALDEGPVVVGIDGSSHAWRALHHALDDAAARDVRTVVVVAETAVVPEWAHAQVAEAREVLVVAGIETGPVDVVAVDEAPVRALLEVRERHGAALLVVGHRGRGRVASTVLGSVGQGLVAHAPVPLTVVCADPPAG